VSFAIDEKLYSLSSTMGCHTLEKLCAATAVLLMLLVTEDRVQLAESHRMKFLEYPDVTVLHSLDMCAI
jgi:hypothetical protein